MGGMLRRDERTSEAEKAKKTGAQNYWWRSVVTVGVHHFKTITIELFAVTCFSKEFCITISINPTKPVQIREFLINFPVR